MAGNKSSIEAGRGHFTLSADSSALEKGLDAASKRLQAWGKSIASFGASLAGIGAVITAPFLRGLEVFGEMGGAVATASRISGIAIGDLQTLAAGLRMDFDALATSTRKLDQFIAHAAAGTPEATRMLDQLGLSLHNLGSMTEADRVRAVGAAITSTFGDISQRHAAMVQVFGRQGLRLDFQGLAGREQRQRELGGVMSAEDVELARQYNLAVREMNVAIGGLWARIGATIAGPMREFLQVVTQTVVRVQGWVDANRHLLEIVFQVADVVGMAGLAIVGIGGAFYAAGAAVSFLTPMLTLWGLTSVMWAGAAKVAIWAYNGAVAIAHLLTYGWIVPIVAVAAAIGTLMLGLYAYAGYLLYTSGLATRVWNAIAHALEPALQIFDALAATWRDLAGLISPLTSALGRAVSFIADAATAAASATATAFDRAFTGIASMAGTAFGALRDAWSAGNLALIWEIVQVSARIAWLEISRFLRALWVEWKAVLVEVLAGAWTQAALAYADFLDVLDQGWFALWVRANAFLTSSFLTVTSTLITGWARVHFAIMQSIVEIANRMRGVLGGAVAMELGIGAAVLGTREDETRSLTDEAAAALPGAGGPGAPLVAGARRLEVMREAAGRAALRAAELELARAEARGAGADELEELNTRLIELRAEAGAAAAIAAAHAEDGPPMAGDMLDISEKGKVYGMFSNQAAFGLPGAYTISESPAARQARVRMEQAQRQHEALMARMAELIRVAGARFA